jgi:hypothetical protein
MNGCLFHRKADLMIELFRRLFFGAKKMSKGGSPKRMRSLLIKQPEAFSVFHSRVDLTLIKPSSQNADDAGGYRGQRVLLGSFGSLGFAPSARWS